MKQKRWQEEFGITTIHSVRAYESYSYIDNKLIILDDCTGIDRICHESFTLGFRDDWCGDELIFKYFEYIEKAYLLSLLNIIIPDDIVLSFIKPEGSIVKVITREQIEDAPIHRLDDQLKNAINGKDVYFFNRMRLDIKRRDGWEQNDLTVIARERFNFLVFGKEMVKEIHEIENLSTQMERLVYPDVSKTFKFYKGQGDTK